MLRQPEDGPVVLDRDARDACRRLWNVRFSRRAFAPDTGALHRRVQLPPQDHLRVAIASLRLTRKDEPVVGGLAELASPAAEKVDEVVGDEHFALVVLGTPRLPSV